MARKRRLFPDTFATIQKAKREGISAKDVWKAMLAGVERSEMKPSARASALAIYQEYVTEVYGEKETEFFRILTERYPGEFAEAIELDKKVFGGK